MRHTPVIQLCKEANEAVKRGNHVAIEGLMWEGFRFHWNISAFPVLVTASKFGHKYMVEYLLRRGVDVNQLDGDGNTALNWAVYNENRKIVEHLIDCGAKDSPDIDDGVTALMYVTRLGNLGSVKKLLTQGADVDLFDFDGRSVFDYLKQGMREEKARVRSCKERLFIREDQIDLKEYRKEIQENISFKEIEKLLEKQEIKNRLRRKKYGPQKFKRK